MSSPESNSTSLPDIPDDTSKGSSVSSDFQREYEEILKFAIVTPKFEIARNVYGHEKGPRQEINSNNRVVSGADGMHLSTIEEVGSAEITETSIEGEQSSSVSSKDSHQSPALFKNGTQLSSHQHHQQQQRMQMQGLTRSASRPVPERKLPTTKLADLSDGARALEIMISNGKILT